MFSLLIGIGIAILISGLLILGILVTVCLITDSLTDEQETKIIKKGLTIGIILGIILSILFFFAFSYSESMSYKVELEGYKAKKYTIEQSLQNNELTGLERIELVNQAVELNGWLAETKCEIMKWTSFDVHDSIKQECQKADFINLEGSYENNKQE